MHRRHVTAFNRALISGVAIVSAACSSGGGDRRVIEITQTNDSCAPASIALSAGEKVTFRITNEGTKDKEIEGIDGTQLEELLVPAGKTRSLDFTAPGNEGPARLKCYVPGGASTIIELVVTEGATRSGANVDGTATRTPDAGTTTARETVRVELVEYTVTPDKVAVSAGPVKFVAHNASRTQVHELAVLRPKAGGDYENLGEVEDIDPGSSGEVVLDLPAGDYVLACLIARGEAGSESDHFQEGMHTEFTVN